MFAQSSAPVRLASVLGALLISGALAAPACSGDSGAPVSGDTDAAPPSVPGSLRVAAAPGLRTGEDGTRATFFVTLGSRPTQPVIVPLTSSNEAEIKLDPSALTFTPDDWDKAKLVTLLGQNDDVADGDQPVTITVGASNSADAAYNGLRGEPLTATNADDDTAGIEVSAPTPTANTTEAGGQSLFTVRLRSKPKADVTIAVSSTKPTEGKADRASLLFTSGNWNVPQTVTVTGQDELVADGDQPYTLTLARAQSTDAAYAAIDPPDVALVNLDDDTPGFLVSAPAPSATTTEAGGQVSFTVRLRSKPAASVTLPVSSSKPLEGQANVTGLTFTTANYDQLQTVTVTGQDDAIDDGDQAYSILLGAATSADATYAGLAPADVALTNKNDDTASVLVSAPQPGALTTEAGGQVSFTVMLASQPTADVTIALSSSKPLEGTANKAQLVFTAASWNVAQTVTVTGQDDWIADGNAAYSIVLAKCAAADAKYAAIDPADVALSNVDNDTAGIAVGLPQPGSQTTEAGAQVTVTVVLQSQPLADVTIPVSSSKPAEGSVNKAQLVFTAASWNVPQTITVTGVDEWVDDGDQAYSLVLGLASSADAIYGAINPADVALTNLDDDTAGLVVSAPAPTNKTTEAGGQVAFTVALQSQPLVDVTIPVASTKPTEGTPDKAQLVFTAATWKIAQTVTVTGQPDGVVDADQAYAASLGASTSGDPLYAGLNGSVQLVNVNIDGCPYIQFTSTTARGSMPQTADWALGSGNWTAELWLKALPTAQGGVLWITNEAYGAHNIRLQYVVASGKVFCDTYRDSCPCGPGTGNLYLNSAPVNDGNWHHVACVRTGGTGTIFTDGVQGESDVISSVLTPSSNASFGKPSGSPGSVAPVDVRIAQFRFSSGARYAGPFVPAKRWAADATTLGLYVSRLTPTATLITDEAGGDNNATIVPGIGLQVGTDTALCQ